MIPTFDSIASKIPEGWNLVGVGNTIQTDDKVWIQNGWESPSHLVIGTPCDTMWVIRKYKHDRRALAAAFHAWNLAIQEKLVKDNPEKSILDLVTKFGSHITNLNAIMAINEIIDGDKLAELLKDVK